MSRYTTTKPHAVQQTVSKTVTFTKAQQKVVEKAARANGKSFSQWARDLLVSAATA